jgi:cell wall-associated NlpC family hydrolase
MMTPMFTSAALADYTVRPGDTLSKIAERNDLTWQSLYRLNRDVVADPDQIYVGQSLNLNGRSGGRDSGPAEAGSFSVPASDGSFGQRALAEARQLQGISYVYGGDSPAEGFDCSGFTSYVFGQAGKQIPRTSSAQAAAATPISRSQLRPGDLIFFRPYGSVSHVAIYAGNGMVWESPGTGQQVRYAGIWDVPRSYGRF